MNKLMQFSLNSVALALVISSSAWALTPADGTPDLALYIPGSQSNDPAFGFMVEGKTLANAVCLSDPLANAISNTNPNLGAVADSDTTTHIYFQNGINDNYSAIYCYTNDQKIPGLTTGIASQNHLTKLWISRRRLGASYVGLDAVAYGTTLTYLTDPSQTAANCSPSNGSYTSGGTTFQYNYTCTGVTAGITASAATSDITPDVFYASGNIAQVPVTTPPTAPYAPILSGMIKNINPLGAHIIGVPVTLGLRNALQYAEITTGLLPSTCTVGNETNASCVPSLTKEQLASIFSGKVTDWTQFQVTSTQTLGDIIKAAPTGAYAPYAGKDSSNNPILVSGSGVMPPLDTKVHLCRRENGAGQQVAFLADILQYPCLGSIGPQEATRTNDSAADVQYATSLGAVDKCLADFNDGSNTFFGGSATSPYPAPPAKTVPHGKQWAIGIQTTERNASNGANYRFIAIDGAAPTGFEAYSGHYRLLGNYTLSWNTTDANTVAALNAIVTFSQQPSTIAARNIDLSNQSFGQAGYLALSDNGFQPPLVWDPTNPVTPYSKVNSSGVPNACIVPYVNTNFLSVPLQ